MNDKIFSYVFWIVFGCIAYSISAYKHDFWPFEKEVLVQPFGNYEEYLPSSQPSVGVQYCPYCGGLGVDRFGSTCMTCQGSGFVHVKVKKRRDVSFGSHRKYKCKSPGCLCTKYEKKSTFNSDCKNCNHSKNDHPDSWK